MSGTLAGRTAIITGASRGIGRACALTLAQAGMNVVLAGRSVAALEDLSSELRSAGHHALAVGTDVCSEQDNDELVRRAFETFGSVDILVANAGVESTSSVVRSEPADWIATVNTNLVGSYLGARAVLPPMSKQGSGQILFVGSGVGHVPTPGRSAYGASKAGVRYLTATLAQEVWRHGISVNELVPGPVATDMTSGRWTLGEVPEGLPSERVKSVDEVATFVEQVLALGPEGPTGQVFSLARRPL